MPITNLGDKIKEGNFAKHPENINKSGRPRTPFSELIKEFGEQDCITFHIEMEKDGEVKELSGKIGNKDGKTINQLIVAQLLKKAAGGDLKAIQDVMDRQEGKPTQKIISENTNTNTDIIIERNIIKLGDIES